MKKIKTFAVYAIFISSLSSLMTAQTSLGSSNLADGVKVMRSNRNSTPFLMNEFKVGYGVYENGETTTPQKINYDAYGNSLVYKDAGSGQTLKMLDAKFVGFIIKSEEGDVIFAKIDGNAFDKEKNEERYYQLVSPPSKAVIIEYEKEFDDPNANGWTSSQNNTKTGEYDMDTKYYILNKNKKYEEVKLKEKSLLKVYKDKKDQLSKYIKTNNIDIDSPEDMVPLVEYYLSL